MQGVLQRVEKNQVGSTYMYLNRSIGHPEWSSLPFAIQMKFEAMSSSTRSKVPRPRYDPFSRSIYRGLKG